MKRISETARGSEMYVQAARFNVKIEISGRVSQRERRALLLAGFRRLQPLFGLFDFDDIEYRHGWVVHRDGSWQNRFRDLERGVRLRQAVKTRTAKQKLGYEIRMRRLKKGLSQEQLAMIARINRAHLSRIERGHCRVKLETLKRVEETLDGLSNAQQLTKAPGSHVPV